jgi:hypothetical protein
VNVGEVESEWKKSRGRGGTARQNGGKVARRELHKTKAAPFKVLAKQPPTFSIYTPNMMSRGPQRVAAV